MNKHTVLQWEVHYHLLWPICSWKNLKKNALATATLKPGFWFRYVDDTLSSWCHGLDNLQRFLDHINSLHPYIKFTYEVQKDDKTIPFLDVLFIVCEDGSLGHNVYRKPTHTDRYLHFNSFRHPSIKNSECKTLINRAKTIISDCVNSECYSVVRYC